MIQVQGVLDAPEAVTTHTEPTSPFTAPSHGGNTSTLVTVGAFSNTGNVPQTLDVTVINPVRCTVNGYQFYKGGNPAGEPVTLAPNESVDLKVDIKTDPTTPGADSTYGFDIESVWS